MDGELVMRRMVKVRMEAKPKWNYQTTMQCYQFWFLRYDDDNPNLYVNDDAEECNEEYEDDANSNFWWFEFDFEIFNHFLTWIFTREHTLEKSRSCSNSDFKELFTCVWWFDFDCKSAEDFYALNEVFIILSLVTFINTIFSVGFLLSLVPYSSSTWLIMCPLW